MPRKSRGKKDDAWYRELAQKLLVKQETEDTETGDDGPRPYIREANFTEIFRLLQLDPKDHLASLERLGLLTRKESDPKGWYIHVNVKRINPNVYDAKTLRQAARRLIQLSRKETVIPRPITCIEFNYTEVILALLAYWGYNAQAMLQQLEAEELILPWKSSSNKAGYLILPTKKAGAELKKHL